MQPILFASTLFITIFWSLSFTNAMPVHGPSSGSSSSTNVLIGWKGILQQDRMFQFQQHPYSSGGGELGDVVYIADGTDLARSFATDRGYVCAVYANRFKWQTKPKGWLSQHEIAAYRGRAGLLHPGSVVFASHTASGLRNPGDDKLPWQLGVRPADIGPLGLTAKCYPVNNVAVAPHQKLGYDRMRDWNIQGRPERGP